MKANTLKCVLLEILLKLHARIIVGSLQNVALGQDTFQVSTYRSESHAVDGNRDSNLVYGHSCSHTSNVNGPWWEVDLGHEYLIDHVVIYNRQDCCAWRLSDVLFQTSRDRVSYHFFYFREGVMTAVETLYPNLTTIGRWFRVSMSRREILALCEVEVMSGALVETRNIYTVNNLLRGTGEIIGWRMVKSKIECTSLCHEAELCYSVNVVIHAAFLPYMECQMMNKLNNETTQDAESTYIRMKTIPLN